MKYRVRKIRVRYGDEIDIKRGSIVLLSQSLLNSVELVVLEPVRR
mgnify:CR=1 FL=1